MKKILSVIMIFVLCIGLVTMTGCGGKDVLENPYEKYNLSDYVTLPDYDSYTIETPDITITDDDIDEAIEEILENAATTQEVTEGIVEKGDSVKISFKGTLADGTTSEGMSSDSSALTLGQGGYIDGFEEGLYGATIGEPVTLKLQFPDPYETNEALSGMDVTFVVTVLSKTVEVPAVLDDEFVKANSDVDNVVDYRKYIADELEQSKHEDAVYDIESDIYEKIKEEAVISEVIAEEVTAEKEKLDARYKAAAEQQGLEWEDFLDQYFKYDQEEYDEAMNEYGESIVKEKMVIYALVEKEGIEVEYSEYDDMLNQIMLSVGVSTAELFETMVGVSLEEYADVYNVKLNLMLDKVLEQIYTRLSEK